MTDHQYRARFVEKVDPSQIVVLYGVSSRRMVTMIQWLFRIGAAVILLLGIYLLMLEFSALIILCFCLCLFVFFLMIVVSEDQGTVARRAMTPIEIYDDRILLFSSFLEKVEGKGSELNLDQIAHFSIRTNSKPNSYFPIFFPQ